MIISIIRTILLYITIMISIKIMGKRQISDLQTSELVVTLLISNIISVPMQNMAQPLLSGILPVLSLVCCEIFISAIMLKSTTFRRAICGKPVIVVNNGEIDQNELKKLRMSVEDLYQQLRQMNVFSIQDVSFAIIETNGKISVLKKPEKAPPTASDLGIIVPNRGLETIIVSDGVISSFSLKLCNISEAWLYETLQKENLNLKEIFLMTSDKTKKYYIVKKMAK
ncbi:MAG: DUF421 domain-containing protein [Candidatus Paraimprobicoccus trichonymphae]|uniref:DUF421 domain-containing protein n=1 Tax=Candidatus Paraimprobicoccus trichonymphae TaxID=3033793 RepID=A0AA48HVW1_9FIRM|nr:MAG: DUF421 domain-containing protein [Candidatus Paraimprobicoccus trichonymphae]